MMNDEPSNNDAVANATDAINAADVRNPSVDARQQDRSAQQLQPFRSLGAGLSPLPPLHQSAVSASRRAQQ